MSGTGDEENMASSMDIDSSIAPQDVIDTSASSPTTTQGMFRSDSPVPPPDAAKIQFLKYHSTPSQQSRQSNLTDMSYFYMWNTRLHRVRDGGEISPASRGQ